MAWCDIGVKQAVSESRFWLSMKRKVMNVCQGIRNDMREKGVHSELVTTYLKANPKEQNIYK